MVCIYIASIKICTIKVILMLCDNLILFIEKTIIIINILQEAMIIQSILWDHLNTYLKTFLVVNHLK